MSLFDSLNAKNFDLFAGKYYTNPQCTSLEEFQEDLLRFKYLKKLFTRYSSNGDLQTRLILNHIIVLYNVFEMDACTAMLFHKIPPTSWEQLVSFLTFLNYIPPKIASEIASDVHISTDLGNI
tara:strand:- start:2418 stop:2786 length:369 start_codon:yes stop_codon:yes gene_type:complete